MYDNPRHSERGALLVLTALAMLIILMIAAFATDLGAWYRQGQEQQRAADVSSLNGVQTYEASRKANMPAGAGWWDDIASSTTRQTVETAAFKDAVNAIRGVLASSGIVISTEPVWNIHAPNPPIYTNRSIATMTADDGTVVVVERTTDNQIVVTVSQAGDRYFSAMLGANPTIVRQSTGTLSNCGATCNVQIVLDPPFAGFSASGNGDGYTPLIRRDSNGHAIEAWAVNHHITLSSGTPTGEVGRLVCMDMTTETFCANPAGAASGPGSGQYYFDGNPTGHFFETGNRNSDYLHQGNGKLYFATRKRESNDSGLACFNTITKDWCSTPFRDLFNDDANGGAARINVTGPWFYNNDLYVISITGTLKCVELDMSTCGSWNTDAHNVITSDEDSSAHLIHAEFDNNTNRMYFAHHNSSGETLVHCFDMASKNGCSGWGGITHSISWGTGDTDFRFTHFRYHPTSHQPTGICVSSPKGSIRSACFGLSSPGLPTPVTGMATAMDNLNVDSSSWGGDALTWEGKVTFFGGGNSNRTGCYDWRSASSCGYIQHATDDVRPYSFTMVTPECVMGLGHDSEFFSFNPEGLGKCVDTQLTTNIIPCDCAGGGERYGIVHFPQSLLNKVTLMQASVFESDGVTPVPNAQNVDLIANGGELDLSEAPDTEPFLVLNLVVNARIDPSTGDPMWTNQEFVDLELLVQATLAG